LNLILKQAIFEIRKLKSEKMILPNNNSDDIKHSEKNNINYISNNSDNNSDNELINKLTENLNLVLEELRTIKQTERFWSYIPCFFF